METSKILVSIIIPCRNEAAGDRLPRFLGELMAEDLSQAEIIVIDDRSDDDTFRVANEFSERAGRAGVPMLCGKTKVRSYCGGARNEGLSLAMGEYVWMIDGDCHLERGALTAVYDAIAEHPSMIICGINNWLPDCVESFTPSASAKIIRRDLVVRFREDWGFEDVDWWIRQVDACKCDGDGISIIRKTLVRFPDECMSSSINRFIWESMKIWSVLKGATDEEDSPVNPLTPASFLRVAAELVDMKMTGAVKTSAARHMLDRSLEIHLNHVRRMF